LREKAGLHDPVGLIGKFDVFFDDLKLARPLKFKGLPSTVTVWHSHCDEVKDLPDGFRRTASNETCAIQAMQQKGRRVYGVQFHPELFDEEHLEGRKIVENFLAL